MAEKIKFVIIGSGNIANTYLSAIQNVANAVVVGVVSSKLNKPQNISHLPFF